jgi:hypothetical protein
MEGELQERFERNFSAPFDAQYCFTGLFLYLDRIWTSRTEFAHKVIVI